MPADVPLALDRSLVGGYVSTAHCGSLSAVPRFEIHHVRPPESLRVSKHGATATALKELRVIQVAAARAVYDDGLVAIGAAEWADESRSLEMTAVA